MNKKHDVGPPADFTFSLCEQERTQDSKISQSKMITRLPEAYSVASGWNFFFEGILYYPVLLGTLVSVSLVPSEQSHTFAAVPNSSLSSIAPHSQSDDGPALIDKYSKSEKTTNDSPLLDSKPETLSKRICASSSMFVET